MEKIIYSSEHNLKRYQDNKTSLKKFLELCDEKPNYPEFYPIEVKIIISEEGVEVEK
jgi:chlorite dismutase